MIDISKKNIFKIVFFIFILIFVFFSNYTWASSLKSKKPKKHIPTQHYTKHKKKKKHFKQISSPNKRGFSLSRKAPKATSLATTNPTNQFSQNYTIHVVAKGENLFRIAKKYNVSLEEIRALNRVSEKHLKIGMELLIPVKTFKNFREKSEELRYGYEVGPFLNYKYHIVQPGETLYRISLKYNVPIEEIQKLNGLEGNLIAAGQKLKIPVRNSNEEITFVLERPGKELKTREDNLSTKFEKNLLARSRILTQAMLSKEDELALKRKFIEIATAYADSRYKLGGVGNGYLDCSAFVKYVFEELGIKLPRSSAQQFQVGVPVEEDELIPGDLVFFRTRGKSISHVGIYIGDNRFIHISSSRKRISIDSLEDPYFKKRYAGAKRVLNGEVLDYFQDYLQRNKGASPREYSIEKKS